MENQYSINDLKAAFEQGRYLSDNSPRIDPATAFDAFVAKLEADKPAISAAPEAEEVAS